MQNASKSNRNYRGSQPRESSAERIAHRNYQRLASSSVPIGWVEESFENYSRKNRINLHRDALKAKANFSKTTFAQACRRTARAGEGEREEVCAPQGVHNPSECECQKVGLISHLVWVQSAMGKAQCGTTQAASDTN